MAARAALDRRRRDLERPDPGRRPAARRVGIHPDQHAHRHRAGQAAPVIAGSDGGVVRSDGKFADVSAQVRHARARPPPTSRSARAALARPDSRSTTEQAASRRCSSRASRSSPQHPQNSLQGGTQDNGTFQFNGSSQSSGRRSSTATAASPASTPADEHLRFNTFTGQANDANFRNGDPTKWVIISGPIVAAPRASFFYPPIIADPNPAAAGRSSRARSRLADAGLGRRPGVPRGELPRVHDLGRDSPTAATSSAIGAGRRDTT